MLSYLFEHLLIIADVYVGGLLMVGTFYIFDKRREKRDREQYTGKSKGKT